MNKYKINIVNLINIQKIQENLDLLNVQRTTDVSSIRIMIFLNPIMEINLLLIIIKFIINDDIYYYLKYNTQKFEFIHNRHQIQLLHHKYFPINIILQKNNYILK